ncbi:MAG: hypothetical protein HYY96_04465 [Candidatus Tectomicrobia bacterium]|nr:hypothetical protein [Candidatus Tectomicrobia bacterium]
MTYAVSTLALLILAAGFLNRFHRRRHIPLMLSAFAIDLGLLLHIEITRHAIEKVSRQPSRLLLLHVLISVLMLLGYVVMVCAGIMVLRRNRWRRLHRHAAKVFLTLRALNYVTSYLV